MISVPIQERGLDNFKELLAEFLRLTMDEDIPPLVNELKASEVANQLATFHVQRLIDAIHERDGIIHDLQQDSLAYVAGVAADRRRTRKIINELMLSAEQVPLRNKDLEALVQTIFDSLIHRLSEPLLLPLPPETIRAENARLREALREVVVAITPAASHFPLLVARIDDMARNAL